MTLTVEIRTYRLKPGTHDAFHEAMCNEAVPFIRNKGMDVVAFGLSTHEEKTYFLIRAYKNRAALESQQKAFYGSQEWLNGPRQRLVPHIDTYVNTIVTMSAAAVESIRTLN